MNDQLQYWKWTLETVIHPFSVKRCLGLFRVVTVAGGKPSGHQERGRNPPWTCHQLISIIDTISLISIIDTVLYVRYKKEQ